MNKLLMITNEKSRLCYIIYVVVLTGFFLYVMFPSRALSNYVKSKVEKRYPEVSISFEKIGLSISPGLKIMGLKIALKQNADTPVYVSEKSSVRFSIPGWLKGNPKYYFKSKVKGGAISGFLEEKDSANKERVDVTIDIGGITLDKDLFIHPVISQRLEGILTGKIKFMGESNGLLSGNTEISLYLAEGKLKLVNPILNLNEISFNKISLSSILDNRRLNIKDLIMTGGPINGTATGAVQLDNNILSSRLRLSMEIEPLPSLFRNMPEAGNATNNLIKDMMKNGKLKIDIQGTLEKPSYEFR